VRITQPPPCANEQGGVIGTAGHGAASLINIKLTSSKYLVDGKELTCFPWSTEVSHMNVSDYGKLLPFNMEEVLKKRGAELIVCPAGAGPNKACTKVVDGRNRLETASYADEAQWVAEQMTKLLLPTEK
jgi:putative intracellular protease/amidase